MKFYTKEELKDSRIFFDKKPPAFVTCFIVFVAVILVLMFVISSFLIKPYVVKAQGVVNTSDNRYVSVNVNGTLMELLVQEGEQVSEGQELMKISNGQEGLQVSALQAQLDQAEAKLEIMDRYQRSLNDRKNYMTNSGLEQEYYGYVEYYLSQVTSEQYTDTNTQNSLNEKQNQLSNLESEIQKMQEKKQSITDSETSDVEKQEIDSQISSKQSEATSLDSEIKSLNEQINNPSSQAHQMYSQLIMELGKSRTSVETQIIELESNLAVYSGQAQTYTIKASNNGIIHYLTPLTSGMSVQQNQVLAEISLQDAEQFMVEAYINATDIAKVSVGDKVNVAVSGVNMNKYGTLQGTLSSIDSGTITQESENGNMLLYRANVVVDDTKLTSKNDTIQLIKSMPVEARIVYEEETYLEWILELLNFRN